MKTSAKNLCVFCPTPVHHMSVLHVLVHEMQLEFLWGNGALFSKCKYRGMVGELGRTLKNCGDLRGSAGICGEPTL